MTEPEWDHPPVTLGRAVALLLLAAPGLAAYLEAGRTHVLPNFAAPAASTTHLLAAIRSVLLLVLAVAAGLYAAPRMGFNSRVQDRINYGTEMAPGLRADLLPAALVGLLVGGLLSAAQGRYPPPAAVALPATGSLASLPLRLLYGGVVEELLLRWGAMSLLVLGLTTLLHRRTEAPSVPALTGGLLVSTLLFGLGHLPAAAATGPLTREIVVWVLGANGVAGLAYGALLWRQSLEAAILGHASTHVVLVAASLAPPSLPL